MKALLAICMIVVSTFVWADKNPAPIPFGSVVKGEVLEVKDVPSYTYLRLKTKGGEIWAAVSTAPVKKGAEVTIEDAVVMKNFPSTALKKTFPRILFGTLAGAGASTPGAVASTRPAPAVAPVKGEVIEVKDVPNYTYLRLKTKDGETWAAVSTAPVKIGAEVTIEGWSAMDNFESKSLKKVFPKLLFGTLASAPGAVPATAMAHSGPSVKGKVLEVKDVANYTYLRLKTKDGETWAAVSTAPVKIGAEVTIENAATMKNFESKSLKKTFPTILFGTLGGAPGAGHGVATTHPSLAMASDGDILIPKASGENARTVAEIITKSAELKDKPVLVHGRVVKYNSGIMGKNWIHLRDGSGSAANNTNDVLVTTKDQANIGDILMVKGIVRTDKNFGSGYAYKVLIEDATLQH